MALLEAAEVTVRFGGLAALDDARISVEAGEVTGMIGPNGAGKTTFFNVLTGLQETTTGKVTLDGRDITNLSVHKRARLGVARTFQKLEVFDQLSVLDNVLVAAEMRRRWDRSGPGPRQEAHNCLDRVGISGIADVSVAALPTGTARLVELARALATHPRVLLLDEPSSGLNGEETNAMAALLRELTADGLAVLLVEHDMSFVMGLCARINVLSFGQILATGCPEEVQADPAVQAAYLGADHVMAP